MTLPSNLAGVTIPKGKTIIAQGYAYSGFAGSGKYIPGAGIVPDGTFSYFVDQGPSTNRHASTPVTVNNQYPGNGDSAPSFVTTPTGSSLIPIGNSIGTGLQMNLFLTDGTPVSLDQCNLYVQYIPSNPAIKDGPNSTYNNTDYFYLESTNGTSSYTVGNYNSVFVQYLLNDSNNNGTQQQLINLAGGLAFPTTPLTISNGNSTYSMIIGQCSTSDSPFYNAGNTSAPFINPLVGNIQSPQLPADTALLGFFIFYI